VSTPRGRGVSAQEFVWSGVDVRGNAVSGTSSARNDRLMRAHLRRQGITPRRIRRARPARTRLWTRGISGREIALFSRQWVTLLSAGVPLVQGLELIAGASQNPRLGNMLTTIAHAIAHGAPVHEALGQYPAVFDRLYRHLVRVGETTGTLDVVLGRIADEREQRERLSARVLKALYYPAIVLLVAALVCGVLVIVVVPQFEQTFSGFGAELPAFTQMIIAGSRLLARWWWALIGAGLIAAFALISCYRRSPALRQRCDAWLLRLPLIGRVFTQAATARFARALATTVQAGVPLLDALEVVAGAAGNRVFEAAALALRAEVAGGGTLAEAMARSGRFAPMPVQMVAIGEEAGALDAMLHNVAGWYEQDVNNAVDGLSSLLEPVIMLIIGGVVGALVVGMYLPVFNLAPSL